MISKCQKRREGDEWVCYRCGLRWAVDDPDPPPCKAKEQLGLDRLREIRIKLGIPEKV